MFRRREEIRKQITDMIAKFKEKGSTSPEKAMTTEELGLPPMFKDAMQRRLGKTGIFAEINGKYYLSKERLKEVHDRLQSSGF